MGGSDEVGEPSADRDAADRPGSDCRLHGQGVHGV